MHVSDCKRNRSRAKVSDETWRLLF